LLTTNPGILLHQARLKASNFFSNLIFSSRIYSNHTDNHKN